jgi:hypothetical protein
MNQVVFNLQFSMNMVFSCRNVSRSDVSAFNSCRFRVFQAEPPSIEWFSWYGLAYWNDRKSHVIEDKMEKLLVVRKGFYNRIDMRVNIYGT